MAQEEKPVFWSNFFEQKQALQKLISESAAGTNFYLLLSISTFITSLGLLVDNVYAIIGGMLVAPLLFPILSLSMGVTTSNRDAIVRSLALIGKSTAVVISTSLIVSILFSGGAEGKTIIKEFKPDLIFLLIAFAAGVASSYAWVKQNLSESLPGVAVAVSLIPPLCAVGIGVNLLDLEIISNSLTLFAINLFGISVAGLIIFSLFGFSKLQIEEIALIKEEKEKNLFDVREKIRDTKEKLEKIENEIVRGGK